MALICSCFILFLSSSCCFSISNCFLYLSIKSSWSFFNLCICYSKTILFAFSLFICSFFSDSTQWISRSTRSLFSCSTLFLSCSCSSLLFLIPSISCSPHIHTYMHTQPHPLLINYPFIQIILLCLFNSFSLPAFSLEIYKGKGQREGKSWRCLGGEEGGEEGEGRMIYKVEGEREVVNKKEDRGRK